MHVHDRYCSLAGRFPTYLLAFACTKWEFCWYIQNLKPKLSQMSPPYQPICGITLPFQVNLHVPSLKDLQINIPFVCLDRSWNDRRWSVSSMLSGLFLGRVFIHSPSHGKRAVIGVPSPKLQKEFISQIIKQKLPMES